MPKLITTPFAVNGQKNEITVNTPESDNSATYDVGFPAITSLPIASGGKPPKGADFNGLFYDITDNIAYLTLGNGYVFNTGLSYPLNARISRTDGVRVRSTVANNTINPNTSMTSWEIDSLSPSQNLLELTDKATSRTNLGVYSKDETNNIAGTPIATETVAGKAKIATTATSQAGADDADFITPKKLKDVNKMLKGWFTTSGTTISGFGGSGITGVTRVAIGVYTISTSFDIQTNPVFLAIVRAKAIAEWAGVVQLHPTILPSVNSITIVTKASGSDTYVDYPYVCFGVF